MKLATFKYTDLKGKESDRKVLLTSSPTNKYSGIDVSDCDDDTIAEFAVEYDLLHETFINEVESLKSYMDLKHNYRQFLEKSVVDMQTETI